MIIFVSSYDRYKYIVVSKEGWVWYLQILKGCDASNHLCMNGKHFDWRDSSCQVYLLDARRVMRATWYGMKTRAHMMVTMQTIFPALVLVVTSPYPTVEICQTMQILAWVKCKVKTMSSTETGCFPPCGITNYTSRTIFSFSTTKGNIIVIQHGQPTSMHLSISQQKGKFSTPIPWQLHSRRHP
jgi:hypothetical protein